MKNLLEKDEVMRNELLEMHKHLTKLTSENELSDTEKKLFGELHKAFLNIEANYATRMIFNKDLIDNVQDN